MSNPVILIVEDNPDNRTLLLDVLGSMDYEIVEAENGEDGVEMAGSLLPDMILMDLSLPKMDGWEATKLIKGNPATAGIPIVALTAHAMVGDRERALEAGCDGYVAKPIDFPQLMQVINELLTDDA